MDLHINAIGLTIFLIGIFIGLPLMVLASGLAYRHFVKRRQTSTKKNLALIVFIVSGLILSYLLFSLLQSRG